MANDADVSEQFIKIPMAMQKAFCRIRIPGEARQVLDSIIRWTIGWQQRTKHEISIGLLCKMTDIKRSNVIRSVKCLEDMHIILSDRANRITAYEINLSYEEWQSKPKHKTGIINDTNQSGIINDTDVGIINDTDAGIINDTEIGIVNDTHNRKKENKKENTHKESLRASGFSFSEFEKMAVDFCERVAEYHPKCKPESIELAAKILAGIGESPDEISRAIEFGFADAEFWRSNIQSAKLFAKYYARIQSQMKRVKKVSRTSNQDKIKSVIAHYAIEECKTIHELMTIWEQNPDYEEFDDLKNERNLLLFQMASQRIADAETEADLNDAFTEAEMFFTATVPSIATLFCEKMETLTGDHDWTLDPAEIIEMNDAFSENETELTGFE